MILRRTLALEPTHQYQALTIIMPPGVVIPQTVQRDHKNGGPEHNIRSTGYSTVLFSITEGDPALW
jgi:hypothetical protein